jgi:lipoate-protein ligase A
MFYKKFLQPVIEVYRRIGIQAEYKAINDVIVETRKISGTGVGEIGDCIVYVGNLIVDFNYDMMARILKVPDEKFRDKVHKTLTENLSTIRRELGEARADRWGETELNALLAEEFERLLGPMEACERDDALKSRMNELGLQMMTDDWLFQKGKRVTGRDIKIREGTKVIHKMHKAPGGLMRADFGLQDGKFAHVSLSGDFFCFPAEAIGRLEKDLKGQRIEEAASLLLKYYDEKRMDTPGIGLEDWLQVLKD